jgi:hypothetical protein
VATKAIKATRETPETLVLLQLSRRELQLLAQLDQVLALQILDLVAQLPSTSLFLAVTLVLQAQLDQKVTRVTPETLVQLDPQQLLP